MFNRGILDYLQACKAPAAREENLAEASSIRAQRDLLMDRVHNAAADEQQNRPPLVMSQCALSARHLHLLGEEIGDCAYSRPKLEALRSDATASPLLLERGLAESQAPVWRAPCASDACLGRPSHSAS